MPLEVNLDYYNNFYKGETLGMTDEDLEKNIKRALDTVHIVTEFKIKSGQVDIDDFPLWKQINLKDAVCVIAESYIMQGGQVYADAPTPTNVSIEGFSYSLRDDNKDNTNVSIKAPERALELLRSTGILYGGINVC